MFQFASLVSLEEGTPGYVKWPNASISDSLQVTLKFRTLTSNSLIFAIMNISETNGKFIPSSLSLRDGIIVFESRGDVVTTSAVGTKYNDNEWHVLTATHNETTLGLDIDDTESYTVESYNSWGSSINMNSATIFIGGLPEQINLGRPSDPFVGCIGDATVNGIIINFANTTERPNTIIGKCRGGEPSKILF